MSNVIKCDTCHRRYRGHGEWNATVNAGIVTGYTCPDCQTPEQNAEAVVNAATLGYATIGGLSYGFPKVGA
ncbi:hypothetical protein [Corynebacterium nuruki]|uniref:hypothetical protein n=1 Tax=Corynebacterium nuruki TaxID=1032851 RepID=UPI0039BF4FCB